MNVEKLSVQITADVKNLVSNVQKATSSLTGLESVTNKIKNKISSSFSKVDFGGFATAATSAANNISIASQRMMELREESSTVASELDYAKAKLWEMSHAQYTSEGQMRKQSNTVASLQSRFNELEDEVRDLTTQFNAQAKAISPEDLRYKELETEVINLTKRLSNLNFKYRELKDIIDDDEWGFENAAANNELKKTQEEIKRTKGYIQEYKQEMADLKSGKIKVQDTFTTKDGKTVTFTPQVDTSEAEEGAQEYRLIIERLASFAATAGRKIGSAIASTEIYKTLDAKIGPTVNSIKEKISGLFAKIIPDSAREKLSEFGKAVRDTAVLVEKGIGKGVKMAFQGVLSAIKGVANAMKKLPGIVKNVAKGFKTIFGRFDMFGNLANRLGKTFKRLGGLFKRVLFFSVFTMGFRAIRNEISAYLGADKELQSQLASLKGAWFTAFEPIYSAILPIIKTLVSWITALGKAFASLTSMFAGKSTKAANENAKALYEQAHATEAAGGAAAEAQKQLAGFDDLTVLQDNSGGGGGGAEEVSTPNFDLGELAEYTSFGDWLNSTLDNLISKLPNINAAFEKAANGINNFFKAMYEGFTSDGVLDKVITFSKGFADAINNFIGKIDWDTLGRAIGSGLNFIIHAVTEFLYGIDWIEIGKSFATSLNGLFNEIDFGELGKLLVAKFNYMVEMAKGFFENLDWKATGLKIADGIRGMIENIDIASLFDACFALADGILTTLSTALGNIDFSQLGQKIADGLNRIDFNKLLTDLGKSIQGILKSVMDLLLGFVGNVDWMKLSSGLFDGIFEMIEQINWGDLIKKLGALLVELVGAALQIVFSAASSLSSFLADIFRAIGLDGIAGFFDGLSDAMKNIGTWIKENIFDPFVNWIKKLFGIHSPSTVMAGFGHDIILGLLQGLKDKWDQITKFLTDGFNAIKKLATETWNTIKTKTSEVWNNIKTDLSNKWNDIKTNTTQSFNNIKTTISTAWTNIKSNTSTTLTNIKNTISTTWNNVKTNTSTAWSNIKSTLSTTMTNIKSDMSSKWDSIKSNTATVVDAIKTKATSTFTNIKNEVSTTVGNMKSTIETTFTNMKSAVSTIFDGIKTGISNTLDGIKTKISSWASSIGDKIKNLWDKITGVADAGNNVEVSANVPAMASGGVVRSKTLAMIGEYSNARSNPEIVTPEDTMRGVFAEVLGVNLSNVLAAIERNTQATKDKDTNVYMDGVKLTRQITKTQNNLAKYGSISLVNV